MPWDELEQCKQNILIKLNNVFDNPQKEAELKAQLEEIEASIERLNSKGTKKTFLSENVPPSQNSEIDLKTIKPKLEVSVKPLSEEATIRNEYFDFRILKVKQTSQKYSKIYCHIRNKTSETIYITGMRIYIGDMYFDLSACVQLEAEDSITEDMFFLNSDQLELCGISDYSELKECIIQLKYRLDDSYDDIHKTDKFRYLVNMQLYDN